MSLHLQDLLRMKSFIKKIILIPIIGFGLLSLENCCYDDPDCCTDCYEHKEWGYKAVYSNDLDDIVSLEEPRPLRSPGKIYVYNDLLLINEVLKGVHIYNNSDPANPVALNFLKIAGCNDMAMRNGILYTDQFTNLITIRLDSLERELEKNRLLDVFQNFSYYDVAPDSIDVYYECPNPSLGVVVNWVQDSVEYPCYKY